MTRPLSDEEFAVFAAEYGNREAQQVTHWERALEAFTLGLTHADKVREELQTQVDGFNR